MGRLRLLSLVGVAACGSVAAPPPAAPTKPVGNSTTPLATSHCDGLGAAARQRADTNGVSISGEDPRVQDRSNKILEEAVNLSCVLDHWDATLVDCVRTRLLYLCSDGIPRALARNFNERVTAIAVRFGHNEWDIAGDLSVEGLHAWQVLHPRVACPASIDEVWIAWGLPPQTDQWGHTYELICPSPVPHLGIGVASAGADGIRDTDDDLRSWDAWSQPSL